MATASNSTIQILRSYANTDPANLLDGQLAFSFLSNTLFIGGIKGGANISIPIGGNNYAPEIVVAPNTYYTSIVDKFGRVIGGRTTPTNLQIVTDAGYTTTNPIIVFNSTPSNDVFTGAVIVTGGIASQQQVTANSLYINGLATFRSRVDVYGDIVMQSNNTVRLSPGSAQYAPLNFIAGTLKTNPVLGDMEFDGGQYYVTKTEASALKRRILATTGDIGTLKPVRAVVNTNISLSTPELIDANSYRCDGVLLSNSNFPTDRIALVGQTNTYENGIYLFSTNTSPLIRASDMNAVSGAQCGTVFTVAEGNLYSGTFWTLLTTDPVLVNSSPLIFQMSVSQDIYAISSFPTDSSGGLITRQSYGQTTLREVTANVESGIFVVDGDGVDGNPTIDINVIPISRGGTGVKTKAQILTSLGVAGAGKNTNITELDGLQKPLRVQLGGTGSFRGGDPTTDPAVNADARTNAKRNLLLRVGDYGVTASGEYKDQLSWPSVSKTNWPDGYGEDLVLRLRAPKTGTGAFYVAPTDYFYWDTPYPKMAGNGRLVLTATESYNAGSAEFTRKVAWRAPIDVGYDYTYGHYDYVNVGSSLVIDATGNLSWAVPPGGGTMIGLKANSDDGLISFSYTDQGNPVGIITTNGVIHMSLNTIPVRKGGTGNSSPGVGWVYSDNNVFYANTKIPGSAIVGDAMGITKIGGSALNVYGVIELTHGGTGATDRVNAIMNLTPSWSGNSGKSLVLNYYANDVSWQASSGLGTVYSVGISVPSDGSLIVTNSPITAAGDINLKIGVVPVANGGTGNNTSVPGWIFSTGTTYSPRSTIPGMVISGDISGNAGGLNGTLGLQNGGTGAGGSSLFTVRADAKRNILVGTYTPAHKDALTYWDPPGFNVADKVLWKPVFPIFDEANTVTRNSSSRPNANVPNPYDPTLPPLPKFPALNSSTIVYANSIFTAHSNTMGGWNYKLSPFLRYVPSDDLDPYSYWNLAWQYPYPDPQNRANTVLTHLANGEIYWSETSKGTVRDVKSNFLVISTPDSGATFNANAPLAGIGIEFGGTAAVTRQAAINNLLPNQGGKSGYVLATDGTDPRWQIVGGIGTVTSVALDTNVGEPFSITGSPITAAGTFNIALTTVPISKGGTGGVNAGEARTNIGAAKSGINTDITRLSALSTPLTVAQGGTGKNSLTGYIIGNGTGPFTSVAKVPISDTTLGTMAGQNSNLVGITGGTISGVTFTSATINSGTLDGVIIRNAEIQPSTNATFRNLTVTDSATLAIDATVAANLTVGYNGVIANDLYVNGRIYGVGISSSGSSSTTGTYHADKLVANSAITINSSSLGSNTVLFSTTTTATLDSFFITENRSVKYMVVANTASKFHTAEVMLMHDGANTYISQYGELVSSDSLGTFTSSITSALPTNRVNLLFTPSFASTTVKYFKIASSI